ncbi:MAG TPA: MBL fold metallo-hydrolase, partial [Burkholderiaceae bacterium]|nr:MBL fold metallo-hydrolase [Burkholderiaceae bacterium]
MNPLEAHLDYPFGATLPALGSAHEVAPGLLWLRMGLPFALDHINLWLVEDEFETFAGKVRGWTAVDCGIASEATRAAWETVFATQLRGLPIVRVIATHCHPDHIGLADWLCSRWNAPLWMTAGEYAFARIMSAGLAGANGTAAIAHFKRHGLADPVLLQQIEGRKGHYAALVPTVPASYARLQDRQMVRIGKYAWRVITGFGHAPEHAALYCADLKVLISGDMILPRISTNVSVFAEEPQANPVQQYLHSLTKYSD